MKLYCEIVIFRLVIVIKSRLQTKSSSQLFQVEMVHYGKYTSPDISSYIGFVFTLKMYDGFTDRLYWKETKTGNTPISPLMKTLDWSVETLCHEHYNLSSYVQ